MVFPQKQKSAQRRLGTYRAPLKKIRPKTFGHLRGAAKESPPKDFWAPTGRHDGTPHRTTSLGTYVVPLQKTTTGHHYRVPLRYTTTRHRCGAPRGTPLILRHSRSPGPLGPWSHWSPSPLASWSFGPIFPLVMWFPDPRIPWDPGIPGSHGPQVT